MRRRLVCGVLAASIVMTAVGHAGAATQVRAVARPLAGPLVQTVNGPYGTTVTFSESCSSDRDTVSLAMSFTDATTTLLPPVLFLLPFGPAAGSAFNRPDLRYFALGQQFGAGTSMAFPTAESGDSFTFTGTLVVRWHVGDMFTEAAATVNGLQNLPVLEFSLCTHTLVPLPVAARILDTRPGGATADGAFVGGGDRPAGSVLDLTVAGRVGVPAGAAAVVLNVTVQAILSGSGFVTVFPCGASRPNTSNLNFGDHTTLANAVMARMDGNGHLCVYTSAPARLVVDVIGYFPNAAGVSALPAPARLLDTRPGAATADGLFAGGGLRAPGSLLELPIAGRAGVPLGAGAAVLNVTAVEAEAGGFVTVYPCGAPTPNTSNVNFVAGQTVPNSVVARLAGDGRVCLFSSAAVHVLVDVSGYFPAGGALSPLAAPARLADTRVGARTVDGLSAGSGTRPGHSVLKVKVAGRAAMPATVGAVVLNVTAVSDSSSGFVTVFPCGPPFVAIASLTSVDDQFVPNTSNLNFVGHRAVPNTVVSNVGDSGEVCLFASDPVDLIVDVSGFFLRPTA